MLPFPVEIIYEIFDFVDDIHSIYTFSTVLNDSYLRLVVALWPTTVNVAVPEWDPRNRFAVSIGQCQEYLDVFTNVHLVPWIHNVYLVLNNEIAVPLLLDLVIKRYDHHIKLIDWPFSSKELPSWLASRVVLMRFCDRTLMAATDLRLTLLRRADLQQISYPWLKLLRPDNDTVVDLTVSGDCEITTLPTTVRKLKLYGQIGVVCELSLLEFLSVGPGVTWKYLHFPKLVELVGGPDTDLDLLIRDNPQLELIKGGKGPFDYELPNLKCLEWSDCVFTYANPIRQWLSLRHSVVSVKIDCPEVHLESSNIDLNYLSLSLTSLTIVDIFSTKLDLAEFSNLHHFLLINAELEECLKINAPQLRLAKLVFVDAPNIVFGASLLSLEIVCVTTMVPLAYPCSLKSLRLTDDKITNILVSAPLESCQVLSNSLIDLTLADTSSLRNFKCYLPKGRLRLGEFTTGTFGNESWDQILISPYYARLVKFQLPLPATITLLKLKDNTMAVVPRLLHSLSVNGGCLPVNIGELAQLRELELEDLAYSELPLFLPRLRLLKLNHCRCTRWKLFRELELQFDGDVTELEQLSIMLSMPWSWKSIEGRKHCRLKILNVLGKPREGWRQLERKIPGDIVALCNGQSFNGLTIWDSIFFPNRQDELMV